MNNDSQKNTPKDNFKTDSAAFEAVMRGMNGVADAVKITIGAKGRNALINTDIGPFVTNDGIAIAESIHFADGYAEMGAELLRDIARKTNRHAGDGTTTSIVTGQAIIKEGLKESVYGITLKESLDEAKKEVIAKVRKMIVPSTDKLLKDVAIISSESKEYGNIIYQAQKKIGVNGYIDIQTGHDIKAGYEVIEGIEIQAGYASPIFRNQEYSSVLKNPMVLVTTETFFLADILPLVQKLATEHTRPFVLVCKDVQPETLRALAENHLKSKLRCVVIKEPFIFPKEFFEDFARATGTQVISPSSGIRLRDVMPEDLGTCEKIITTDKTTRIIGGEDLTEYAKEEEEKLKARGKWEEVAQRRVGGLTARIAVLRVTAASESELAYRRLKIEDAVNAAKSAQRDGILPGGGTTLYRIAQELGSDTVGKRVLKKALEYPIRQIIINSGNNPDKILPLIGKGGFDAKLEKIVPDMIKAGIIDPAEVTINVIENAISVAGSFLTNGVAIEVMR